MPTPTTPTVRAVITGPRKVTLYVRTPGRAVHLHDQAAVDRFLADNPTLEPHVRPAWDDAVWEAGGTPSGMSPDAAKVTVAEALDMTRRVQTERESA